MAQVRAVHDSLAHSMRVSSNGLQYTAPIRVEIILPNRQKQSVPASCSTTIEFLKKLVPNYDGSSLLEVKFQGQSIAPSASEDIEGIFDEDFTLGGALDVKLCMDTV